MRNCQGTLRQRLLLKFTENDHEKVGLFLHTFLNLLFDLSFWYCCLPFFWKIYRFRKVMYKEVGKRKLKSSIHPPLNFVWTHSSRFILERLYFVTSHVVSYFTLKIMKMDYIYVNYLQRDFVKICYFLLYFCCFFYFCLAFNLLD